MPSRCLVIQVLACDTTEAMRRAYLAADPRADVVELRLDLVKDLDLDRLVALKGKPKLATVRSRQHGGGARPADREALLRRALDAGIEYVDLEYGGPDLALLKGRGRTRRILSHHDFNGTPADLESLHREMRAAAGDALLKIVTFADAASDVLRVRDLLRSAGPGALIAFCMGTKGIPSRILAPLWGSAAVYAPARGAADSAPGQVPLEDLFDLYRFDRIGRATRLLGVLGFPIGHSLSPPVHNAALRALDLDYRYLPFEAKKLAEFLPLLSEMRLAGLSVTLPHKETILPHLDVLDDTARRIGAVNTVVKVWNRLEGKNTDADAAVAPLRARLRLQGARVAVMGAGGAARAVVHGLLAAGARVTVFNRTASRGRDLARALGTQLLPWARLRGFRCDLLVNATSLGMAPGGERTPLPASWIAAPAVYDIVYNPPETRLLREARARGLLVIGGVEMFVAQAAAQFTLFTGRMPPVEVMRRAALQALGIQPGSEGADEPRPPRKAAATHPKIGVIRTRPPRRPPRD
ncbi:MAG: shikimate dehydrogenase [Acidobacteria bacterium]|nr:shikimate dehydrogenase [Acidobacteriota bacterium]